MVLLRKIGVGRCEVIFNNTAPAHPDTIRLKDRLAKGLPIDPPRIYAHDHVRHVGITTERHACS